MLDKDLGQEGEGDEYREVGVCRLQVLFDPPAP